MKIFYTVVALKDNKWEEVAKFKDETKAKVFSQALIDINKFESKVIIKETRYVKS